MSEKSGKKTESKKIYIIIVIISIIGIFIGIYFAALGQLLGSDFERWGALILVSLLLFNGALASLNRISYKKRTQRDKRAENLKKPTRKSIIWITIAIASGAGTILAIIFYVIIENSSELLALILVGVLPGLLLFSEYVLISGRTQRIRDISEVVKDIDY